MRLTDKKLKRLLRTEVMAGNNVANFIQELFLRILELEEDVEDLKRKARMTTSLEEW